MSGRFGHYDVPAPVKAHTPRLPEPRISPDELTVKRKDVKTAIGRVGKGKHSSGIVDGDSHRPTLLLTLIDCRSKCAFGTEKLKALVSQIAH